MRITIYICLAFLLAFLAAGCGAVRPAGTVTHMQPADPTAAKPEGESPVRTFHNDLKWLVENSTLVFVGNVVEQDVSKDSRGLIITKSAFRVERVLAGELLKDTVSITTLGGKMGRQILRVSHIPQFAKQYKYVIFVDLKRTTYDPVVGNEHGVFIVGPDDGVYTYHEVAITAVEQSMIKTGVASEGKSREVRTPSSVGLQPETQGDVLKAESAAPAKAKPMSLCQFSEIVKTLSKREQ